MKFILINSNNETSFAAFFFDGSVEAKYTSEFLSGGEKNAFLKSPDKLIHCLKYVGDKMNIKGVSFSDIDAVSVTIGPGSFTGIRVGIALAKGLADSIGVKIIPIDNFELILKQSKSKLNGSNYAVIIPAKFPEFYYTLYNNDMQIDRGCIKIDEFIQKFNKNTLIVSNFSDEYEKKLGYLEYLNVKHNKSVLDSMIELTIEKYRSGLLYESEQIDPLYLKDFTFRKISDKIKN